MVKYIIEKRKICSSNVAKFIGSFFECEINIKQQLIRNGCSPVRIAQLVGTLHVICRIIVRIIVLPLIYLKR
jgi:hypothetical protein